MTFGQALVCVEEGKTVRKKHWRELGRKEFLRISNNPDDRKLVCVFGERECLYAAIIYPGVDEWELCEEEI